MLRTFYLRRKCCGVTIACTNDYCDRKFPRFTFHCFSNTSISLLGLFKMLQQLNIIIPKVRTCDPPIDGSECNSNTSADDVVFVDEDRTNTNDLCEINKQSLIYLKISSSKERAGSSPAVRTKQCRKSSRPACFITGRSSPLSAQTTTAALLQPLPCVRWMESLTVRTCIGSRSRWCGPGRASGRLHGQ